jgi:cysteine synthase A
MLQKLSQVVSYVVVATVSSLTGALISTYFFQPENAHDRQVDGQSEDERLRIVDGVAGLVGNTPMMRIPSLSKATGCEIWVSG